MVAAEGEENQLVYSGKTADNVYLAEGSTIQSMPERTVPEQPKARTKAERIEMGAAVFKRNCVACHQAEGQGVKGAFPPLAGSDFLNQNPEKAISAVTNGLTGEITVNGAKYNNVMPKLGLSDEDIANVMTYVFNNWKNKGNEVTPAQVAELRQ